GVTSLEGLQACTRLEWLHMGHNAITDLSPLSGCQQLVELDLRFTNVSNVKPLRGLESLRRIFVQDTPVTEQEIAALAEALPDLEFCDYSEFWRTHSYDHPMWPYGGDAGGGTGAP